MLVARFLARRLHSPSPMQTKRWWELAAGVAGGLLGTRLLFSGMARANRLPRRLRPPAPTRDPGDYLVSAGERLLHRRLPRGAHRAAARSLGWTYGTLWPLGLAALSSRIGVRSPGRALAAGAALGLLVWAAGALWLPAVGLTPPLHRQKAGGAITNLLGHVTWGTVASLPLAVQKRM
jgi:hypothetical protein